MTQHEAAQVLAILKAAYPNSYKGMTPEEATGTINVWAMQFIDISVDIVMMAIHKHISTNPFPPAICEVKEKIHKLHWEAYEYVNGWKASKESIDETVLDQYTRIYAETKLYKHNCGFEPSLRKMISGNNMLLLGSGKE